MEHFVAHLVAHAIINPLKQAARRTEAQGRSVVCPKCGSLWLQRPKSFLADAAVFVATVGGTLLSVLLLLAFPLGLVALAFCIGNEVDKPGSVPWWAFVASVGAAVAGRKLGRWAFYRMLLFRTSVPPESCLRCENKEFPALRAIQGESTGFARAP